MLLYLENTTYQEFDNWICDKALKYQFITSYDQAGLNDATLTRAETVPIKPHPPRIYLSKIHANGCSYDHDGVFIMEQVGNRLKVCPKGFSTTGKENLRPILEEIAADWPETADIIMANLNLSKPAENRDLQEPKAVQKANGRTADVHRFKVVLKTNTDDLINWIIREIPDTRWPDYLSASTDKTETSTLLFIDIESYSIYHQQVGEDFWLVDFGGDAMNVLPPENASLELSPSKEAVPHIFMVEIRQVGPERNQLIGEWFYSRFSPDFLVYFLHEIISVFSIDSILLYGDDNKIIAKPLILKAASPSQTDHRESDIQQIGKPAGRPHLPDDLWAWEQMFITGRDSPSVKAEWKKREGVVARKLQEPDRQFHKIKNWKPITRT